jgi:S-adenosylmethionine hydrolase
MIANTFAELHDNELGLISGSSDFMELCLKNDSAAKMLTIKAGAQICLNIIEPEER